MTRRAFSLLLALGFLVPGSAPAPAQDGGGLGGGGLGGDPGEPANDPSKPLPVRINQAIDSGVAWLLGRNKWGPKVFISAAGNWSDEVRGSRLYDPNAKGDEYVHPTGCTALSLYALLKSGVSKEDPVVKKGFQWLRTGSAAMAKGRGESTSKRMVINNRIPGGTYEIAALILALEAKANPHKMEGEREREVKFRLKKGEKLNLSVKLDPDDQAWMKDLVDALRKRMVGGSGWRYGMWDGQGWHNGPRGDKDLSASNLAMLALAAAERCGFQQDGALYAGVLKWTLGMQEKEGPEVERWNPTMKEEDKVYGKPKDQARGFGYLGVGGGDDKDPDREKVATGSMTCCGLANILICTSFLEARENPLLTGELAQKAEKAWWDGVAWLDFHWSVSDNINHGSYHYYYLYCLERACDLKRINLLAGHPWYNDGAQVLVDQQDDSGAWTKNDTHKPSDVLNTCFALLFLNRATPAITGND